MLAVQLRVRSAAVGCGRKQQRPNDKSRFSRRRKNERLLEINVEPLAAAVVRELRA